MRDTRRVRLLSDADAESGSKLKSPTRVVRYYINYASIAGVTTLAWLTVESSVCGSRVVYVLLTFG